MPNDASSSSSIERWRPVPETVTIDFMKAVAVITFLAGLLLGVRVMFFGVRRRLGEDLLHHRRWPLALAAFLMVGGAMLYAKTRSGSGVTPTWVWVVVGVGAVAGAGGWWFVKRSAAIPSSDPEDDPRYRFQGHVAQVTSAIRASGPGRIVFDFDGKRYEFAALWSPDAAGFERGSSGLVGDEVVIERIDDDVAYVEPWTVVEQRL